MVGFPRVLGQPFLHAESRVNLINLSAKQAGIRRIGRV